MNWTEPPTGATLTGAVTLIETSVAAVTEIVVLAETPVVESVAVIVV